MTLLKHAIDLETRIFAFVRTDRPSGIEGFVARLVFVSVLFRYYLESALGKFDGLLPNAGAYAQILPKVAEQVGYDVSQMSLFHHVIVFAGCYGEIVLVLLVAAGLLARSASVGMMIFIAVQSFVDITGHMVDPGMPFDRLSSDLIADQRLLWVFVLFVIVMRGPGFLSLDRLVAQRRHDHFAPAFPIRSQG